MPSLFGPSEGPWWRTQVDLLAVLFLDFLLVFIEWIGPQQKSGPAALAAGPIHNAFSFLGTTYLLGMYLFCMVAHTPFPPPLLTEEHEVPDRIWN